MTIFQTISIILIVFFGGIWVGFCNSIGEYYFLKYLKPKIDLFEEKIKKIKN